MNAVFADSYYYLAIVSDHDAGHERAVEFARAYHGRVVTTDWVLLEVADALSAPQRRQVFLELIESLRSDGMVIVIEASRELFDVGLRLFADRQDKAWSLTDCTSFVVMQQFGLGEPLTADHHFEQAGYIALLN